MKKRQKEKWGAAAFGALLMAVPMLIVAWLKGRKAAVLNVAGKRDHDPPMGNQHTFVVDGFNVAHVSPEGAWQKQFSLDRLRLVQTALAERYPGARVFVYLDRTKNEARCLEGLQALNIWYLEDVVHHCAVPDGVEADVYVLRRANIEKGIAVSNDLYRKYRELRCGVPIMSVSHDLTGVGLARTVRYNDPGNDGYFTISLENGEVTTLQYVPPRPQPCE